MLKVPVTFDRFSSRADGSFGLGFTTQEGADVKALQDSVRQFGWLVFSENSVQDSDIPEDDADEEKTPSQRLRASLYRLWESRGKLGDFNTFYRAYMEKVIEGVKGKIEKV